MPVQDDFICKVNLHRDVEDEPATVQEEMLKANRDLLIARLFSIGRRRCMSTGEENLYRI